MLYMYPACFFKEQNGYSVVFPDLNHAATQGDTVEDAMKWAVDLLAVVLDGMKEDNEPLPRPSEIAQIDIAHEWDVEELGPVPNGSFVSMVTVDPQIHIKKVMNKRVNIKVTIPKWLKDCGVSRKLNFSQVLTKALYRTMDLSDSEEDRLRDDCVRIIDSASYEQCCEIANYLRTFDSQNA